MFTKNTSIFLSGYRQSWKYFLHRENEVRSQFVFNEAVQKDVDTFRHAAAQIWRILEASKIMLLTWLSKRRNQEFRLYIYRI